MAEMGILDDIQVAKNDLMPVKKVNPKNKKKDLNNHQLRRSPRVEVSQLKPSADPIEMEKQIKIEIEVKIEPESLEEIETSNLIKDNTEGFDASKAVAEIISKILKSVTKGEATRFQCKMCDYSARDNYNLKRHIEIQHFEIQVKCLTCTEEFASRFYYEEQLPDCFNVCPCENCAKKFKIKSRFESHQRMHIKLLSPY